MHGGVDGYSRLITFLKAADNNKASTVLERFVEGCRQWGLPSRVRCDHGSENSDVVDYMTRVRNNHSNPVIQGASVHNQRIERLWVDVWKDVVHVFYNLFYYLEQSGHLNPDDDVDLYSLHYIYLPRINKCLQDFVHQWNNHGIRTEKNMTPIQLFVSKSMDLARSNLTGIRDLGNVVPSPNEILTGRSSRIRPTVNVPSIPCPLNDDELESLTRNIDPLDNSVDTLGIANYLSFKSGILQNI